MNTPNDLLAKVAHVAGDVPVAWAQTREDALAIRMARYGIDLRARSALKALASFRGLEAAIGSWAIAFADTLLAESAAARGSAKAVSRFVDLFFQLPARDFDGDWLRELGVVWKTLLEAGCNPDLPLRVAHQFTARCVELIKRNRSSYSRLDAEIALAVGAAGMCVCAVLADDVGATAMSVVTPPGSAEFVEGGAKSLRTVLEGALAHAQGNITGLLTGQLEPGSSSALVIDEGSWAVFCARALSRLRQQLRDRDVLCRVDRSRFSVVLPGLSNQAQVMLAATKVARMFEAPVLMAGRECRMLVRVGAAWAPDHGRSAAELMSGANLAMHEAARLKQPVALYQDSLKEKAEHDSHMEDEFLRALNGGGLELYFQPQIDVASGRCRAAEALLRWPSARCGAVPPPVIIETAERLGVALQLTRFIIHHACRCVAAFVSQGIEIAVSINLTAGDIGDAELPLAVRNAMDLWQIDGRLLKFELTESAMLANEAVCLSVMSALQKLGVSTSIDDFGTGYSSVILLKKLPLNELKLDRCFVGSMATSPQDREIVRSLILLARGLKLEVVAEGVEDEATLAVLREFGCDRAQGYLISKPLPAQQFLSWVRGHAAANKASPS